MARRRGGLRLNDERLRLGAVSPVPAAIAISMFPGISPVNQGFLVALLDLRRAGRYLGSSMFPNLLGLIARKNVERYEFAFVREVHVRRRSPRNRRTEKLFLVAWLLIIAKCFLTVWVVRRWNVPVDPAWVILPTLFMAAICTLLYLYRE
jgi:hypothetical protein